MHLPTKKSALDLIVAFEVVEHLGNPDLALREFHRRLKSGGILILTTPSLKSPSDQKQVTLNSTATRILR